MMVNSGTSRAARLLLGFLLAVGLAVVAPASAQPESSTTALRQQVERRFEVLPLRDGVALRPRSGRGVRSIELSGDTIAIDGAPATGGELRQKLGADDADLVLRLSYLTPDARRGLFAPAAPPAPAPPAPPSTPEAAPAPPSEPSVIDRAETRAERRARRRSASNARVRFGGDITVGPDEVIDDSVVVIGGSAHIEGAVRDDVVVIGGTVDLGPKADVSGDVVAVGGTVHRDPAAHVGGEVNEIGFGGLTMGRLGRLSRRGPDFGLPWWEPMMVWGSAVALMSTLTRLAVLCLIAALVVLLARDHVERIGARAVAEPFKAGAVGLLAELLFVPLLVISIVVLVVTIIGIPLLILIPFALVALVLVFVVGFTSVAYDIGRAVNGRLGWAGENPYLTAILGIAVVLSPLILARLLGLASGLLFPLTGALAAIGFLFEYLVWTIGFGAVALTRFSPRPPAYARPAAVAPSSSSSSTAAPPA